MTTTPTFWGNEVTISTDINAIRPDVTALADGTFAIVWESGPDLFGRHLNELGSFTGGNFMSAVSSGSSLPLFEPRIFQQADGRVVVNYNRLFDDDPVDRDIFWHSPVPPFTPHASVAPVENTGFDEIFEDSTARSDGVGGIGSAAVYRFTGPGGVTSLVLRFISATGVPVSNQIFIPTAEGEVQQNAALAGRHTGQVVVAYENFNNSTLARDIRFHSYAPNETDTTGEVIVSAAGANAAFPDAVALGDGTFVVTWQQNTGIAFRRYFGNGTALDEAPVPIANSGGLLPKITALNDGGFIIAWVEFVGTEGDGSPELDVALQRFNSQGVAVGDRVFLDHPGDQGLNGLSLATLADGRVILTYVAETGDATNINDLNYQIVDPREATLFATNGDDNWVGREDATTLSGLDGDDRLTGRAAADVLSGNGGHDTLMGGGGKDTLNGDGKGSAPGLDVLLGQAGADSLFGGGAPDLLRGGGGRDLLSGGAGGDTLAGNGGADTFRYGSVSHSRPANRDKIADFTQGVDVIDVHLIDARAGTGGDQAFVFGGSFSEGRIRATQAGAHTLVEFNTDSDSAAEMAILLRNFNAELLTASDFDL